MSEYQPQLNQKILNTLLQNNSDFADVYYEQSLINKIRLESHTTKECSSGIFSGIGLRLCQADETRYGYTNTLTEASLLALAQSLSENNQTLCCDKKISAKTQESNLTFHTPPSLQDLPLKEKINICHDISERTWKQDSRITQVNLTYWETVKHSHLFNSEASVTENRSTLPMLILSITVADKNQIYSAQDLLSSQESVLKSPSADLQDFIEKTAQRALLNFEAKNITGGQMTVVLSSEAGGTIIHEAVGHSLEGDLVEQSLSAYKNKIGTQVANNNVTVWDDPTMPLLRGSYAYDDEGVPAQKTVLIENGILKNYLLNRDAARKLGLPLSGHGRRQSYEYTPIPRMSNFYLAPQQETPKDILTSVDQGLFVKKMGGGQVDTVSGNFVFHIQEAYLIKNGKLLHPVKNCTIAGNGPRMLYNIDRIGSDLHFQPSTCGKNGQHVPVTSAIPTIRVQGLVVGGQA